MPPEDPNEAARQTLREQAGAGNELEDEQTHPAEEADGRPSEDGNTDTDEDESDTGHERDIA